MSLPGQERSELNPTEAGQEMKSIVGTMSPRTMVAKLIDLYPSLDTLDTDLDHPGATPYLIEEGIIESLLIEKLTDAIISPSRLGQKSTEKAKPITQIVHWQKTPQLRITQNGNGYYPNPPPSRLATGT